jgi:hypothetical protein
MSNIKPIETVYNGYRFRSRLEARWAVFFDTAGIPYQYEPEGFVLEDGTHYLPDFYLPWFKCYVEIKPSGIQSEIDKGCDRIGKLVSGKSDCIGLLCIGEPKAGECGIVHYFGMGRTGELRLQSDIVGFYEGCWWKNIFTGEEYGNTKHWISLVSIHSDSGDRFYDKDGNEMPILNGIGMTGYRSDFHDAAIAAKQARFEHGEKGTPKKTLSRQQIEAPHRPSSEAQDFVNRYFNETGALDVIMEWRKIVHESSGPWFEREYRLLDLYARNGYTMHGVWEDQDTAEYQRDLYNKTMREEKGWTEYDPVTGMLIA